MLWFYLILNFIFGDNAFFKNSFVAAKEMIRNYPDSSRPYWLLGVEYYDLGRYEEAAKYFKQHLKNDPRNPFLTHPSKNAAVYHILARSIRGNAEEASFFCENDQLVQLI